MRAVLVLALLISVATITAATQGRTTAKYRSGVDLVTLDVMVTDSTGRPVVGLSPDDFAVFDGRRPQSIELFFSDDRFPLAAVVLIDRSASMLGAPLERARQAAATFIRSLRPGDQCEVIAFNRGAERILPLGNDCTQPERSLAGVTADGETALFDAVLVGLLDLKAARRGRSAQYREALVVITDGEDTTSRSSFENVLDEVRRSGVIVYGISLRSDGRGRTLPPVYALAQLAFDTGGRSVAVHDLGKLVGVYDEIGRELRQMYRLGYSSAASSRDGRWHTIVVRVASNGARVRTRSGYYAPLAIASGGLP